MKIKASLGHIRHCYGVVIELVSESKTRERQLNIVDEYMEKGYNVYWLRHADNDWSRPAAISVKQILANRFGWFITKDNMDFSKNDEVNLSSQNAMYYNFRYDKRSNSASIIEDSSYPIDSFDITTYFDHEAIILEAFKYYVTKDKEIAGIVEPTIVRNLNNGHETVGFGLLTKFKSSDTKPDYAPDFEAIMAINGCDFETYGAEALQFYVCKNRIEYVYDIMVFIGNSEENVELTRCLKDYDIIFKGELLTYNPNMDKMIKKCIKEDPLGFINLDYEDFKFFTVSRYNKFYPKEIMKIQTVAPSRVYSTKSDYTTNTLSDLMTFAATYRGE